MPRQVAGLFTRTPDAIAPSLQERLPYGLTGAGATKFARGFAFAERYAGTRKTAKHLPTNTEKLNRIFGYFRFFVGACSVVFSVEGFAMSVGRSVKRAAKVVLVAVVVLPGSFVALAAIGAAVFGWR